MSRKALRRSAGKALSVDICEIVDHRYHVVWKDENGWRCFASRGSLAEAKSFQTQKIAELERHREGRFNLDDREMLSQARDRRVKIIRHSKHMVGPIAPVQLLGRRCQHCHFLKGGSRPRISKFFLRLKAFRLGGKGRP